MINFKEAKVKQIVKGYKLTDIIAMWLALESKDQKDFDYRIQIIMQYVTACAEEAKDAEQE